jgi:pilus assembly protein Flp/PilA
MSRILSFIHHFLIREDGPTAVEYAVMTALIVVACMNVISLLDGSVRSTFSTVNNSLSGS